MSLCNTMRSCTIVDHRCEIFSEVVVQFAEELREFPDSSHLYLDLRGMTLDPSDKEDFFNILKHSNVIVDYMDLTNCVGIDATDLNRDWILRVFGVSVECVILTNELRDKLKPPTPDEKLIQRIMQEQSPYRLLPDDFHANLKSLFDRVKASDGDAMMRHAYT
jgi:hypothetical protein